MYIWENPNWPNFTWNTEKLSSQLTQTRHFQGRLLGRMEALGFSFKEEAVLHVLTQDVVKSSEIEGEILDPDLVRSSVARRLGMDIGGLKATDRNIEGLVEMVLGATRHFDQYLSQETLFHWHDSLFPKGNSGLKAIKTGAWRDDMQGPMQVISGPIGKEHVHFTAPPASRLPEEMSAFLSWINDATEIDPVLKAALAHLWFVTIHPFEDGNGRIARAIADMLLARSEQSEQRFYSMSAQIRLERQDYYTILEKTQKGSLDITPWMEWFLNCLLRAIHNARDLLNAVLYKAQFWDKFREEYFNLRQIKVINRVLDGFDGNLTSSKWAKIGKCSQDSANRDILDLMERGILKKNAGGGRSTSYSLVNPDGSF